MKIGSDIGFILNTQVSNNTQENQVVNDIPALSSEATVNTEKLDRSTSASNLLENNFVQSDYESSKYIQGVMTGLRVENEFGTKMQSLVECYQLQLSSEDGDNYAKRALIGKKAARATEELVAGEVTETETTRLEKERKESEEKAEKKIEEKTTENSETSPEEATAGNTEEIVASDASGQQSDATAAVQEESSQTKSEDASQGQTEVVASNSEAVQQNTDQTTASSSSDNAKRESIDIVV